MKEINCYGEENKKKLIDEYYIKPIIYLKLLANQEKQGACGKLTDRYYVFRATNKKTEEEFSFYAGKHCAERLLELIKAEPLSFFNPLKSINDVGEGKSNSTNSSNTKKKNLHPVNEELIKAIYVITMAWNSPPPPSILNVITFTKRLNEFTVNTKGVFWISNNLSKDKENRVLSQIYSDLKSENPTLKDFHFDNLRNYMSENYPNEINRY